MPRILHHILALTTLVAACKSPDARAAAGNAAPSGGASSASAAKATSAANGSVAPTPAPHDSISDLADRGRILGDTAAPLWVIMASDFQCPYCKQWHDAAFENLLKTYVTTGRVRLAFLNMPLSMHPNAVPAAEAAMCASVQNKFWEMHDALFASQKDWEQLPTPDAAFAAFAPLAAKLGVNMGAWKQCTSKHQTIALVQADHDRAIAAHVNSTPTFFVGDQVLPGADANVAGAIEAALKARGAKKPPTH